VPPQHDKEVVLRFSTQLRERMTKCGGDKKHIRQSGPSAYANVTD
jgi:hypothetical protein